MRGKTQDVSNLWVLVTYVFGGDYFLFHTLDWSIMLVSTNMHIGESLMDKRTKKSTRYVGRVYRKIYFSIK